MKTIITFGVVCFALSSVIAQPTMTWDSPIDVSTVLNKNLMYLDKDCMDYPRDIILDYELNPENTLN